ncbi:MAG: ice-binding family protein [Polaromonas sp.]|nr:ice-binding family protein [Polaromonas sp.]
MKFINAHGAGGALLASVLCSVLLAACGGGGGGRDPILGIGGATSGGATSVPPVPQGAILPGAACPVAGATVPAVTATDPSNGSASASISTGGVAAGGKAVTASFSLPMNAASINTTSFTLAPQGGAVLVPASVSYNAATRVATLTTSSALLSNTSYSAVIQSSATSEAGTPFGCPYAWSFKTALVAGTGPESVNILASAARYGVFGGSAGMTNTGNQTVITGSAGSTADIGTIATGTSSITGFHDSAPSDIYTEVPGVNEGNVTGKIFTCTTSTTGPTNPTNGVNAASCASATQARLDAEAAYRNLAGRPAGANPGGNLANLTLVPGVYTAPSGSFLIQGGDLTLDAQGDPGAVWVFQMASTLTVGGPASPRSVILAGGAQAKNVFWQVGSNAIINAGGGGTMVGTIISQAGAAFSTAGSVIPLTLNGRALSLGASVTLVNTFINVPAP